MDQVYKVAEYYKGHGHTHATSYDFGHRSFAESIF